MNIPFDIDLGLNSATPNLAGLKAYLQSCSPEELAISCQGWTCDSAVLLDIGWVAAMGEHADHGFVLYREAIRRLDRGELIHSDRNVEAGFYMYATMLIQRGDVNAAKEILSQCIGRVEIFEHESKPWVPNARAHFAMCLAETGDYRGAVDQIGKLLNRPGSDLAKQLSPRVWRWLVGRCGLLRRQAPPCDWFLIGDVDIRVVPQVSDAAVQALRIRLSGREPIGFASEPIPATFIIQRVAEHGPLLGAAGVLQSTSDDLVGTLLLQVGPSGEPFIASASAVTRS